MARVAVVTVHGTFAKNATWVRADSALLQKVVADISSRGDCCDVLPFRWSGANTFYARRSAGQALAALIESAKSGSAPYDEIFLVAHSHGGSVVAYAVRDYPEIKQQIAGVVTLATPWFTVRPERFASENRLLIAGCVSLLILCGLLLVTVPLISAVVASEALPPAPESIYKDVEIGEEGSMYRDPLFSWVGLAVFIAFAIALPAGAVVGAAWAVIHAFLMRKLRSTEQRFTESIRKHAFALDTANIVMPPTIVLLGSSDEASSTLRVVQWIGAATRELFGRLSRIAWGTCTAHGRLPAFLRIPLTVLFFAAFAVFAVLFGVSGALLGEDLPKLVSIGVGSLLLLVAGVVGTSVLSGVSFGTFSLFAQAYCRFGVEPSRFGDATMVLVNTTTKVDNDRSWNGALLNHSAIYLFEEGISATCSAIRRLQHDYRGERSTQSKR